MAGLLLDLAAGDDEEVFRAVGLAFGDRPVALVAPGEEGPAGMGQEQLQAARSAAEQENPGAHSSGHAAIVRATAGRSLQPTAVGSPVGPTRPAAYAGPRHRQAVNVLAEYS
jgi:hypothetical protein